MLAVQRKPYSVHTYAHLQLKYTQIFVQVPDACPHMAHPMSPTFLCVLEQYSCTHIYMRTTYQDTVTQVLK